MADQPLDVAIVGGGPAGLSVAIETARRGLSVAVFERHDTPADKACGEGVMPEGVRVLEELGVRSRIRPAESTSFDTIRYLDEDGTSAEGNLPAPGLAVRRVLLVSAMSERARELGADLRFGCSLLRYRRSHDAMLLETDHGPFSARMLVAADGLSSRLRREENLDGPCTGSRRFGLRQHFRRPPWSTAVEVHLAEGAEAYVTPVSPDSVGVAFLWAEPSFVGPTPASVDREGGQPEARWQRLQGKFPFLRERLAGVLPCSRIRGAGPFERAVRGRIRDRFALVGDAAGYVDAITGEGISLALLASAALGRTLPDAIARGAGRDTLRPYEREAARLFRTYALLTRAVLSIVQRKRLRHAALVGLCRFPSLFDWLLARAIRT